MNRASGSKLGIDATKNIPGEGFKRSWPPLVKMDEMGNTRALGCLLRHPRQTIFVRRPVRSAGH